MRKQMAAALLLAVLMVAIGVYGRAEEKSSEDKKTGITAQGKPAMIVASDYPDLHAAVAAARTLGVGRVYVPAGVYYLDKTLDLSGLSWSPIRPGEPGGEVIPKFDPVIFEGAGARTILIARTGNTPAIDLTGSHPGMVLRDFVLQTPFVDLGEKGYYWDKGSSVGILMSRMSNKGGKPSDPPTGGAPSSGNHVFDNVTVSGNYSIAAVFSWNSEVNTFYHCRFRSTGGDAFVFMGTSPRRPKPREGARSPYRRSGISSNVGVWFYACSFQSSPKDSVGLRVSGAGDVYIIGGYFASKTEGFAAVYLDGTARAQNIVIRDVRMECGAAHNLYAVGAVNDVLIEGGEWVCMNTENIRHQRKVPNTKGPHKYVSNPDGAGYAYNWIIRGLRMSRSFEDDPALALKEGKPTPQGMVAMRFDGLQDSRIGNIAYYVRRQAPDKQAWSGDEDTIVTDTPMIVVDKYSRRNTFEVPSREAVELKGDARGNNVVALADGLDEKVPALWRSGQADSGRFKKFYDGRRRTYVNPDGSGSLQNWGLQNVLEIENPRAGDIALHDGSEFKDEMPRLAVYNGKKWLFFGPEAKGPDAQ